MFSKNRGCIQALVQRAVLYSEQPLLFRATAFVLQQEPSSRQQHTIFTDPTIGRSLQLMSVNKDRLTWAWHYNFYCTEKKLSPDDKQGSVTPGQAEVTPGQGEVSAGSEKRETTADGSPVEDEQQLTVFQRFKKAYKEHGKVLVAVHVATSIVWYSSFVYAAKMGVDVVPVMEWLGFSEKVINPFKNSGAGDFAIAYLMYKLATPARYTVTLTGTNMAIGYLRKTGKMEPKQESLRELVKDSRDEMKEKADKLRGDLKTKRSEMRDKSISKLKKGQQEKR